MSDSKQYAMLAYAGATPFVACAILSWLGLPTIDGIGSWRLVAASYGVAIVSFMAGVHWGTFLYHAGAAPVNLLLTSNAITVLVWLAFVFASVTGSLAVTAAAFALLMAIDYRLARAELVTPEYLATRRNVTLVVVLALVLTLAAG